MMEMARQTRSEGVGCTRGRPGKVEDVDETGCWGKSGGSFDRQARLTLFWPNPALGIALLDTLAITPHSYNRASPEKRLHDELSWAAARRKHRKGKTRTRERMMRKISSCLRTFSFFFFPTSGAQAMLVVLMITRPIVQQLEKGIATFLTPDSS